MHVVLIVDNAHVSGGQSRVAFDSAFGLRRAGHQVTLFAAVGPVDPALAAHGVGVVCLDQQDAHSAGSSLAYAVQAFWNRTAAQQLSKLLATCDPRGTIVHVHAWAKALSPSVGAAIAASGVPAVTTLHEYSLACPNGGFFDFPRSTACTREPMSLKCLLHNCDSRSYGHKLYRAARQAVVNHWSGLRTISSHMITLSALQEQIMAPYLPGVTFHRVDNPVSVEDPGPRDAAVAPGPFVFLGRLSPEKGVAFFAEAARRLGQIAVIAGSGPTEHELRAAYPEMIYPGWQDQAGSRRLLSQARAMVFPSVWYEGQPLSVLESLALGTPVIVSDICAGRESVLNGETGLWFRSADVESLVAAMRELLDDGVARRMSHAAHLHYWGRPFTTERHVEALLRVYDAALGDGRKAA